MKDFNEAYFDKNEYFEKYIELLHTPQISDLPLHKHHIIPRVYFRLLNLTVDNSDENTVMLTPANHAIAHYYLALCSKGELKYRLRACFIRMTGNKRFCETLDLASLEKLNELKTEFSRQRSEKARGTKLTADQKQKISKASKLRWEDPDYRKKMTDAFQERWDNTPKEQRTKIGNKISKSKKGIATIPADKRQEATQKSLNTRRENGSITRSIETRQKISNTLLGHSVSEETRRKISESGKGRVSHNAKAVVCLETGIEYRSARFAEQELLLPKDSVYRCCKGLQEQVNGYHWKLK
jgi:hypothetical protein